MYGPDLCLIAYCTSSPYCVIAYKITVIAVCFRCPSNGSPSNVFSIEYSPTRAMYGALVSPVHTSITFLLLIAEYPLRGKSAVCVMCLKYRTIILIIIIISLGHILLPYISNTSHTHIVAIIAHYKRIGYVIMPKPIFSGREGINSRCRCSDLLLFRHFVSICLHYDRSCRHSDRSLSINRDRSYCRLVFQRVAGDQP